MQFFLQVLALVTLAILPAIAWSYIFLQKTNESRSLLLRVFVWGGISTLPLMLYRWLWSMHPAFNFVKTIQEATGGAMINFGSLFSVPVSLLLIFMTIGFIEEVLKALVITRTVPKKEINSVADAVEFSIIAALGFSFVENVFYLAEVYYVVGASALFTLFISRALFATFAHALFSSIFGYYYGISLFAKKNLGVYKRTWEFGLLKWIRETKLARFLFTYETLLVGICFSGGLHAVYNTLLEMKFTLFLIPFLVFGYLAVRHMLKLHQQTLETWQ